MPRLTLIDFQYLQKVVFSFEKGSNGQNHSSSGTHHTIKKIPPPAKFSIPSTPKHYLEKPVVSGATFS